ncbi:MAG: DUF177 domain-containing protein [Lentisphaerae bacterium]|jgi:uncharacterized protein|nr:DUF177 domain-containing protein [Lentisphaerota bacterium]
MSVFKTLRFPTANIPPEGATHTGEITFQNLAIEPEDRFAFPSPLHFTFNLTIVNNDVVVTGKLSGVIEVMCDRCTDNAPCKVEVDDVFHRYENVIGDIIDLTDDIREDILLVFPQSFLCSDACRGLCPSCGSNLNRERCTCTNKADADPDNPWRQLDSLKLK